MLYTVEEHKEKDNRISDLEQSIIDLKDEHNQELNKTIKEAKQHIKDTNDNAEEKIREIKIELNKAIDKINHLENINSNLIRVAKERANAQRKLQPKKQHCGYLLQQVEEAVFIHKDTDSGRTKISNFPCWRVRFQTPYNISFDLQAVKDLIEKDFIYILSNIINIQGWYRNGQLEGLKSDVVARAFESKDNFYFKKTFKINAVRGFWEIEYWTKDAINYSDEILGGGKVFSNG